MSADLKTLKALALAATPGGWEIEDEEVSQEIAPTAFLGGERDEYGCPASGMRVLVQHSHEHPARKPKIGGPAWKVLAGQAVSNAKYIAAANPAVILALIERLEAAEAAPLPAEQPSNPVPLTDEHRRARKAIQDVIAQLQVLHEGRDPIMAAIITTVALLVDDDLQTVADFLGAETGARIVGQQTKGGGNGV